MTTDHADRLRERAEARVGTWLGPKPRNQGQDVLGRYHLLSLVGHGGMGAVYRALDVAMGREVAVKVADPDRLAEFSERFRQEATSMAAVRSPRIVMIHDFDESGEEPFLVMELLEGQSLGGYLQQHGVLREDQFEWACSIGVDVLLGLFEAHQAGVLHRDMKPDNVFLGRTGVKILDFGIAHLIGTPEVNRLTTTGTTVGTIDYMSPEQMDGKRDMGPKADQFSFGAVFYEWLTGEIPYTRLPPGTEPTFVAVLSGRGAQLRGGFGPYAATLPAWLKEKHPQFEMVLARMLDPDPANRYATALEACRDLAVYAGRQIPDEFLPLLGTDATAGYDFTRLRARVTPTTPKGPIPTPRTKSYSPIGLAITIGIGLLLAMVVIAVGISRPNTSARPLPTLVSLDTSSPNDAVIDDAVVSDATPSPDTSALPPDTGFTISRSRAPECADGGGEPECTLVFAPSDPTWLADAAVPLPPLTDASVSPDAGRRSGRPRRSNSTPETAAERAARELHEEVVRQCCNGMGGAIAARELHVAACPPPDEGVRRRLCGRH